MGVMMSHAVTPVNLPGTGPAMLRVEVPMNPRVKPVLQELDAIEKAKKP
jgi:hypothetical protein